ncbi:MAG: GDYXXLXY domain-containing protein [Chloroflexi bacterium]|nr:GDYXXLXY domain-containing protein [Chloroflexota bacterium]
MKPWVRIAFWVTVAAQLVFLIGFIGVREAALRTGTEVVLQTVPVDPRSLLQGDYAILDYEIAGLPSFMEDDPIGETVYVSLREEGGLWKAAIYGKVLPSRVGDVFIEGRIDRPGHLDFGIGTYFVPEGTGRIIETAEDVKVVVSVDSGGNAVIKEVLVDGKPFDPDRDE